MWRLLKWFVRLELGIWRSLFCLVARRRPGATATSTAYPYARDVTPLLLAFVFGSALELVVVHILLPWETLRWVLFVLSVWGLLWMIGYAASMRVFPHLVDEDGLRIRSGTSTDLAIPWSHVDELRTGRHDDVKPRPDGVVVVPVLKQTRIVATLRIPLAGGETEVRFSADDPAALVRDARARHERALSRSA